jgi:hypothetical protein
MSYSRSDNKNASVPVTVNQANTDPHETYLDAVFAKIDRMRYIDASILTERYGIDPAALSPVDGAARPSWPVERLLADAGAQRAELREHLNALTREFVADGLASDAAAIEAQRKLGDPAMLSRQISRSTAQAVVRLESRWFPWLRSIAPSIYGLPMVFCLLTLHFGLHGAQAFMTVGAITSAIGGVQGYSVGRAVTPDMLLWFSEIAANLKTMLKLPVVKPVTFRQRFNRWNARYTSSVLQSVAGFASNTLTGRFLWPWAGFMLALLALIFYSDRNTGMRVYFLSLFLGGIAREWGCYLGARHRLARSARRIS